MVHVLPLINISGFTPEFDKKNELYLEKHNRLLVRRVITGHRIYERDRWWYGNGQMGKDVNYKNGKWHGRCRWRDESGNLTSDDIWDNGERVKG